MEDELCIGFVDLRAVWNRFQHVRMEKKKEIGGTMPCVMLTGGSGFVGSAVLEELLSRGHAVHALAHQRPIDRQGVQSFPGGLFNLPSLQSAMHGCDAVIHLVGIIRENPRHGVTFQHLHHQATLHVLEAAHHANVPRLIHMSALGARPGAISQYHRTKFAAEEAIRQSDLQWTIFRPSLIHGPGGEFMAMEAGWARGNAAPYFFMPYFAKGLLGRTGGGKIQPIYVKDVARAFVDSLERPHTIGQTYSLAGPDVLDWPTLHRTCCQLLTGKTRRTLPIPAWYAMLLTSLLPARFLPFNRDQVLMSQENNCCDLIKFQEDFGWRPQGFETTLRSYASQL
jgi:NADH dehydrogenase